MLAEARQYHALVEHPWLLAPGLAAIPVLFGYSILADMLAPERRRGIDRPSINLDAVQQKYSSP